jgi:ribose transport system permease protein
MMKIESNERLTQPHAEGDDSAEGEATLVRSAPPQGLGEQRGGRSSFHWLRAYGLVIAWVAVIVGFGFAVPSTFLTVADFRTIFSIQAALVILSLALVVPLAAGEFDLSVAGSLGISYVLVGYLNANLGWPILPVIAIAFIAAVVVGLTNALLVVWLGLDSIVVTLGTGTVLVGLGYAMLNGPAVGVSPALVTVATYPLGGLAVAFWIAVLVTVVMGYVFRFTPTGRYTYFVGANREAARLAGINVDRIRADRL